MASHHGRGNGYSPEQYHFFKVIRESTIRDGKLGIPRKFARDYGNTLSSPVFFEFPNGEVWELELTDVEDEMWVQNGWRKIAEHYSLELGHFLVFRYQGNCRFHVLIFDRSASEIHYPYANGKEGIHQQQVKIEESEEDDSVHIINNFSTSMGRKLVLQYPRPLKVMRASSNGFSAEKGKVKKGKSLEKSKALMKASSAFESENPFFSVFMQPSYVRFDSRRSCFLCIPKEFSSKYLMGHGDVILSDSNGKTWSVEYHSIPGSSRSCVLYNGWDVFVGDNNLQVGDVCIFELINCIDISFQVFIYGGNHGSPAKMDTHQECLEPLKVHEAPELPSDESPEVYAEQYEKLLDNTERSWTLSVDAYGSDERGIYDSFKGKTCHHYRHGEHVPEANKNPNWVCPARRGICNCSLSREAKGWTPTGPLYKKISKMGFNSVTHDLIQTCPAHNDMEKNPDNTDQVSAKRSLSFPAPELPSEDFREVDDNQLVPSKPQTGEDGFNSERKEYNAYPVSHTLLFSNNETVFEKGEPTEINLDGHGKVGLSEPDSGDKRDEGKELNFTNKEPGGSPVTSESIPKRKRGFSIEPNADSIAGRVRQRRGKGTSHHETTGVNGEGLDGSGENVDEGCTATESRPKLMERPASATENGLDSNAARPKKSRELGSTKHSTSGTDMDCIARRLRPRRKAL